MSEESKNIVKCPCCNLNTLLLPIKPKEDDILLYMACLLSGLPFKKLYKIWNDRICIEATQISLAKLVKMQKVASKIAFAEKDIADSLKIASDIFFSKAYISKITLLNKHTDSKIEYDILAIWQLGILNLLKANTVLDILKITSVLTDPKKVSAVPLSMIQKVVKIHNNIIDTFALSSFDANFFEDLLLD